MPRDDLSRKPSVGLFAHSTNPRGGVVHTLELAEALTALGHRVTVHAPDATGRGFFRATRCTNVAVPARPVAGDGLAALVEARIADYLDHFDRSKAAAFDVHHAQDGISGNALATLRDQGRIPGYVYTVHHIDRFDDPAVEARQWRAIRSADRVLCVSRMWRDRLALEHGIRAALVGNGVDLDRFTPHAGLADEALRQRLGLGAGPIFLSVGGVEARKNSARLLRAFLFARRALPDAQLVVAGGATLLDHSAEARAFDALLAEHGVDAGPGRPVIRTGPLPDADMPALFRLATALVFPSLVEGFGLVVLEAMASGTPAIVSSIPPFTEHLASGDALWVDPLDPAGIAAAMIDAARPERAGPLRQAGLRRAAGFGWDRCARRHAEVYADLFEHWRDTAHA
ncbi:MSMEG_0565 family glycosyltransferase [Azospirillum rugosum]|uniref:Glycosyltransferase-like protein n=1 Tax=Azospirillum rugosum TaxID=416170 RepID=A0ABS4SML4_9PROT|nr:MSMEG_0565 family glycosyltransferase [Azospirillum rugosum]MBP2293727.1 glycosyltransferase-like protein [Azospirillum rugosum]MDQ0527272.1 glycosyltransferase-like protein [Azospirillum rugosum]